MQDRQTLSAMSAAETDLCIVGGGPAGMVAGLLFARAGVRTTVLEKHADFLRDFRGDTVHPSTLRIFSELGLLEKLLQRLHDKVQGIGVWIGGRHYAVADLTGFDPRWNFVAMMPQWEFLDFVADAALEYPHFRLLMETEAAGLERQKGRVSGVRYLSQGEQRFIRARLIIASDGRRSDLREEAGLSVEDLGAPMDVFWFRLRKARGESNQTTGVMAPGRVIALIDRGDYWQCGFVFAKGDDERVREQGLDRFREEVSRRAPMVAAGVDAIASWDDVKLLSVSLDRLSKWYQPGLLVIGDAAHAMSPVAGVGINVAIQDAVAAANILAGPMARGEDVDPLLALVEKRRLPAVRLVQGAQRAVQQRIIAPLLASEEGQLKAPIALRLLDRFPFLRRLPGAAVGFGYRPERVRSPAV